MEQQPVYGYRKSSAFRWIAGFLVMVVAVPFVIEAQGGQLSLPKSVIIGGVAAVLVPLLIKHWNNAVVLEEGAIAYRSWMGSVKTRFAWSEVAQLRLLRHLDEDGKAGAVIAEVYSASGDKIAFVETIEDFEHLLNEIAQRSGLSWE